MSSPMEIGRACAMLTQPPRDFHPAASTPAAMATLARNRALGSDGWRETGQQDHEREASGGAAGGGYRRDLYRHRAAGRRAALRRQGADDAEGAGDGRDR